MIARAERPIRAAPIAAATRQLTVINDLTDGSAYKRPMQTPAKGTSMRLGTICIALAILASSPAIAQAGRYDLFPEPEVRQPSVNNRVASAYVIDKKANQFWICTARYNFQDLTANNGDCVQLPSDIGRPSLSEAYDVRPVTGTTGVSAYLPVFWFIEPTSGDIQFCAVRHAGLCVKMKLPG